MRACGFESRPGHPPSQVSVTGRPRTAASRTWSAAAAIGTEGAQRQRRAASPAEIRGDQRRDRALRCRERADRKADRRGVAGRRGEQRAAHTLAGRLLVIAAAAPRTAAIASRPSGPPGSSGHAERRGRRSRSRARRPGRRSATAPRCGPRVAGSATASATTAANGHHGAIFRSVAAQATDAAASSEAAAWRSARAERRLWAARRDDRCPPARGARATQPTRRRPRRRGGPGAACAR